MKKTLLLAFAALCFVQSALAWGKSGHDAVAYIAETHLTKRAKAVIERLRDYRNLDDSTVVVNLRYVIHLVGDMHCPSHVNYQQSRMRVLFYGVDTQYHALFDGGILDRKHRWGYMEYKHQLDRYSRREREALAAGTPDDWFAESRRECAVIYDWAAPGDKLGLSFCNKAIGLLDHQLIKASYRLAKVLNELFG